MNENIEKPAYAGIGSRRTPKVTLDLMFKIGKALAATHIARSGAADGADKAIEAGVDAGKGEKEIYLPSKGWNGSQSKYYGHGAAAAALATMVHPIGMKLVGHYALRYHARNGYQILGRDLTSPVEFVVAWTPGGKLEGGTAQALKIANLLGIPVYNLYREADLVMLRARVTTGPQAIDRTAGVKSLWRKVVMFHGGNPRADMTAEQLRDEAARAFVARLEMSGIAHNYQQDE